MGKVIASPAKEHRRQAMKKHYLLKILLAAKMHTSYQSSFHDKIEARAEDGAFGENASFRADFRLPVGTVVS